MLTIRPPSDIVPSEITPRKQYLTRREFIAHAAMGSAGVLIGTGIGTAQAEQVSGRIEGYRAAAPIGEEATPFKDASSYNNYYEFSTDKYSPAGMAGRLKTRPWQVQVDGEVAKPRTFGIEDLLKLPQQERIYRMRCVEGWSMVIPWIGFEFSQLAQLVQPTANAKYVEFITAQQDTMPGIRMSILDWPYAEGLRIDEAMHPLTLLTVGMYGQLLPNQNGAPVRLVVPWKYGFKSAKSLVRIRFTSKQPGTAWNKAAANEYGFYSNVNPQVDHPRWSQATERRIGEFRKRPTLMFNGYADQVAGLYTGMDLNKNF